MKRKLFLSLAAVLAVLVNVNAWAQSVVRGPYLQQLTDSSVIVRWRTDLATDSVVRFGTSAGSLSGSVTVAGSRTEHSVELSSLSDATRYYYSVGNSGGALAGDSSYFFGTAPLPGVAAATRFWVLGDSGTANASAIAVRDAYQAWSASDPADFMLMLGDNAYNSGTDLEYQNAVFNIYPLQLRQLPLWATLGNHDGGSASSSSQSGPYYDIFELPTAGEAGGLASGTEAYYAFDYGNIHFVVLDSYDTDTSPTGNMMQWLEADLATNDKPWVIAFWHHPPYTKGSHDSDSEGLLIDMRERALPILEAWGVDLVMTGHSHSYERSVLLDGHYGASGTFDGLAHAVDPGDGNEAGDGAYLKPGIVAAEHAGAVYAVAGSSGKISGGSLNHPAMIVSLNSLGSMVIDVAGDRLDGYFLNSGGSVADHFTVLKSPDADPPLLVDAQAIDASSVRVTFSERLDSATASDAGNYAIAGLAVNSAALEDGNRAVSLQTSVMTPGVNYVLTVDNVEDESGNPIAPGSQLGFQFNEFMSSAFQDGLAPVPSYAGTRDTYIRGASATTNYGASVDLQVDGDEPAGSGSDMSILLAWDVSDLPASAIIDAASIVLNNTNVGGPYYCYALRRAWNELTATWNQADTGQAWATPGALGASDSDNVPLCTVSTSLTGPLTIPLNADGLDVLQGWVDGSLPNNGLLISDSATTNGADFDSSESGTAMNRPRLEVSYYVPALPPNTLPIAGFGEDCTGLSCDFTDTSTDSDGTVVAWSWDFGDGNVSSAQNPGHVYASGGTYTVTLQVTDNDGGTDSSSHPVTVSAPVGPSDHFAVADLPGAGTVGGNYSALQFDDDDFQSVTERESGGRKNDRYSYLEHTWQFSLPPSALATVHANAWHGGSVDDQFVLSWSVDGSIFADLLTISDTDPSIQLSMSLPGNPSGTVYLRVRDSDRTPGNKSLDTVYFDQLFIRTEPAGGSPPAAPSGLTATAIGHDQVDLSWTDNAGDESGFEIERSVAGGAFTALSGVGPDQETFSDLGLSGDTEYGYRVRAYNAAGNSAWSNVAADTTGTPPTPVISLFLSGSKDQGRHVVELAWSGAIGATVQIFRDGGLLDTVTNLGGYTDSTGNKGARTYVYAVCETGTANCSPMVSISF